MTRLSSDCCQVAPRHAVATASWMYEKIQEGEVMKPSSDRRSSSSPGAPSRNWASPPPLPHAWRGGTLPGSTPPGCGKSKAKFSRSGPRGHGSGSSPVILLGAGQPSSPKTRARQGKGGWGRKLLRRRPCWEPPRAAATAGRRAAAAAREQAGGGAFGGEASRPPSRLCETTRGSLRKFSKPTSPTLYNL